MSTGDQADCPFLFLIKEVLFFDYINTATKPSSSRSPPSPSLHHWPLDWVRQESGQGVWMGECMEGRAVHAFWKLRSGWVQPRALQKWRIKWQVKDVDIFMSESGQNEIQPSVNGCFLDAVLLTPMLFNYCQQKKVAFHLNAQLNWITIKKKLDERLHVKCIIYL